MVHYIIQYKDFEKVFIYFQGVALMLLFYGI